MKFSTTLTTIFTAVIFPFAAALAQPTLKKFDINPNGPSNPDKLLTVAMNRLFFYADDGVHGSRLMSYDGTFVKPEAEVNSGPSGFAWSNICEVNGKIYMAAYDSTAGAELFEYDGVNPPTLVKDVYPGQIGSYPKGLIALNNVLYFQADVPWPYNGDGLYSYDPATGQLKMIYSGAPHVGGTQFFGLAPHNNTLIFTAQEYIPAGMGHGLYSFNPATSQVDTIMAADTSNRQVFNLLSDNAGFYFANRTTAYGAEIYKYDGINPPVRLTNFNSPSMTDVGAFTKLGDQLVSFVYEMGKSLYVVSFNETTGTASLIDTAAHNVAFPYFGLYNSRVYYSTDVQAAWPSAGMPLFVYDGLKTRRLSDFVSNAQTVDMVQAFQVYKGELYFPATDNGSGDEELYKFSDANLGVKGVGNLSGSIAYPNPATSMVQIGVSLNENAVLQVVFTDMQGRVVYSASEKYATSKHELTVPVSELAAGSYMYTVMNEAGTILAKGRVVKQ